MPRKIKSSILDTRTARAKLKARGKPYWVQIGEGLHLGYRKGASFGKWVKRTYQGDEKYTVETFALADDTLGADGEKTLDFWQAQEVVSGKRVIERREQKKRTGYTVEQTCIDYVEFLGDRQSAYEVHRRLKRFVVPEMGDQLVENLKADELRAWHRGLALTGPRGIGKVADNEEAKRKRKATANRILSNLKSALNHAHMDGKCGLGAWTRVAPFKGVDKPRDRYLEPDECQRLLNAADAELRILIRAGLETGARAQELARLRVADFSLSLETLHVRKTKTAKPRRIELTDEGVEFFKSLAVGRAQDAPLLGREWPRDSYRNSLKKAIRAARLGGEICFHTLRHTWASLSIMEGVPTMVVAQNMGHKDTRMVERIYGHLANTYVREAIRRSAPRFGVVDEPSKVTPMASGR